MAGMKLLGRLAVVAAVVAGGLVAAAPVAQAWGEGTYVHIVASDSGPVTGESITVSVTTDWFLHHITGWVVSIRNVETGEYLLSGCDTLPCKGTVTESTPGPVRYETQLHFVETGTFGWAEMVTVNWHAPVVDCLDVPEPAEVCVTTTTKAVRAYLYLGEVYAAPRAIAGYLDRYTFTVGATVTIVCPVLVQGSTTTNPCKTAGGTYVGRVATLIDTESLQNNPVFPAVSVDVCNATLKALVAGVGVNSAPIYQLC